MFRKLKDAINNVNTQKLKRDAEVFKKRFQYKMNQNKQELKKTWNIDQFYKNYGQYIPNKSSYSRLNESLKGFEVWYTKKRDKVVNSFDNSTKNTAKSAKNFGINFIKTAPIVIAKASKTFFYDTKDYVKSSYSEGRAHIKDYFRKNQKYFSAMREKYFGFFKRSKRSVLLLFGATVFLYALGSNIPGAYASYQIKKKQIELQQEQLNKNSNNY
ncbi:unnamed protein product [Blepharisma stoltei]|uniref:Uncharacterized protein n=1 Tax=Blepharisma stoltei TaxID=1481888 RepID=A0AAU9JJU4_9CILI|nr:unnamed protein product [Blepharisma stoltei]